MNIKNDQRGFTIIELITSFSLTMVVLIFLFNVVILMKETYTLNATKSDLIVNQALMSTALNEDLYNEATSFKSASCSSGYNSCYTIGFSDSSTKKLSISTTNKKVKYGDIEYSDDSFSNLSYSVCASKYTSASYDTDSVLKLKVTLTSNVVEDQTFGFNVIYLFDSSSFTVSGLSSC